MLHLLVQSMAFALGALVALLITMLAIPVSMNFSIQTKQGAHGSIGLRWLFGLIKYQSNFPGQSSTKQNQAESILTKVSSTNNANNNNSRSINLLKNLRFRRHIIHFMKRMLHAIYANNICLKLRIGLSDPADTGRLWAIIGVLSGLAYNLNFIKLEIEPEFTETTMHIDSHGQFYFIPLQLSIIILLFLISPTTIQAWRRIQQ